MAIPLRKILKNPKFDAVVSFKKQDGGKSPRGTNPFAPPAPGGKSPTRKSPTDTRKDKTPKTSSAGSGKAQKNKPSPKSTRGGKDDGGVTSSSVVAVLADKGAFTSKKNNYHNTVLNGAPANRANRLQVRLNALESEMSKLKLHEEQLEHRLKRFIRQKTALVNTIDDIHLKLDGLARSHKAISSNN